MTRKTGSYLVPPYFSSYPTTDDVLVGLQLGLGWRGYLGGDD